MKWSLAMIGFVLLGALMPVSAWGQEPSVASPEMKALEKLLGTWKVENIGKVPKETRSSTIAKRELVLSGRFVQEVGDFDAKGKPSYACMYTYDPNGKTYRWWFFHASAPEPCLESTGTWDETRQTFTFVNKPEGGGTVATTFRFRNETSFDWSMIVKDAGGKVVYQAEAKAVRQK